MTLQAQFTIFRTVPSTVVACCPCTACPNCGEVPRFWAVAARGATTLPRRTRANANIRAVRTQLVCSGRWMTVASEAAVASERRQKAGAILMSLSLLDSGARGLRVERENRSKQKLGQISGRTLKSGRQYLQSIVGFARRFGF